MIRIVALLGLMIAASSSLAADRPRALVGVLGGEWSVGRAADGHGATRQCVADPASLALWEHRQGNCRSVTIADRGNRVVTEYRCEDGGFGRSEIEVLTPRTLRIATQGISHSFPFNYVMHARYVGACLKRR